MGKKFLIFLVNKMGNWGKNTLKIDHFSPKNIDCLGSFETFSKKI